MSRSASFSSSRSRSSATGVSGQVTVPASPQHAGNLAELSTTSRGSRQVRQQAQYMRSSSHNPYVDSPKHCEFPISVASATPKGAWAPQSTGRPVNRRGYISPSFWVEQVESGRASRTTTYLDYGLTNGFHKFWKDECEKEERFANGGQPSRRKPPVRRGRDRSPSARPTPLVGRMSLARLTQSSSTPAFWPAGRSPVVTWKP
mmetsp:Transcript_37041/g.74782  ORF Transcript_37041/g.74782 Transcript_37041/m.74782 type:complete len:203 (-) Transcript_37041:115-723(-)